MKIRKIQHVSVAALAACILSLGTTSIAQTAPAAGGAQGSAPTATSPMKNPVAPMPGAPPVTSVTPSPPTGTPSVSPATPGNQPLTGRNRIPSRSDTAGNAFRTLDTANRGYVTKSDTDRILGFMGFENADVDRDGRLTAEEFANAWKSFGGQ